MSNTADIEFKERLIRNVKKEVKQIMEEAVTRKFVHEDSSTITSLCGAVEACLSQGLRRRALGLFKTSSTTALLHKAAKGFEPAAIISQKVLQIENQDPNRRSSSSGESFQRPPKPPLQKKNSSTGALTTTTTAPCLGQSPPRYLWIRLALFEKQLAKIIGHLAQNSNKYYEKDALISDPDYGSILSSLLVGPCALDYSKSKRQEQFWTDPPADELVQRHRISQGTRNTPPAARRHNGPFNSRRSLQGVSAEESLRSGGTSSTAKDYVESLHQNSRATLLYGKNNVLVLPKDHTEPMPGYLSLHQCNQSLTIKWTPNQLMNGYGADAEDDLQDKRRGSDPGHPIVYKPLRYYLRRPSIKAQLFMYWEYAMNVQLDDIVYVHCHQQGGDSSDSGGGTVILVGQDGVQRPPIHFPKGGHLLAFLGCLENGLMPHGQLDPPLWSQRGKGKVFPKLKRRGKGQQQSSSSSTELDANSSTESTDYVFRIVNKATRQEYMSSQEYLDTLHLVNQQSPEASSGGGRPKTRRGFLISSSTTGSSTSSSKSLSLQEATIENPLTPPPVGVTSMNTSHTIKKPEHGELTAGDSIELVCATMKRQIISRAFYGWLAYCRHLSTVRTHLSGLVYHRGNPNSFMQALKSDSNGLWKQETSEMFSSGLTEERWIELKKADPSGRLGAQEEIFAATYFGGVAHNIRKEAWPYLLGHYSFDSTTDERDALDTSTRQVYETTMSEWLAVEAIVRQRDKETQEANHAKLSSESCTSEPAGQNNIVNITRELSNDVFEDAASVLCSDDDDDDIDEDIEEDDHNLIVEEEDGAQSDEEEEEEADKEAAAVAAANELLCADKNAASARRSTLGSEGPKCPPNSIDRENKSSSSPDEGVDIESENLQDKKEKHASVNGETATSSVIINHTNPSVDSGHLSETGNNPLETSSGTSGGGGAGAGMLSSAPPEGTSHGSRSTCVSPASSQGGVYTMELLETFGLNLHRIDKDVQRCDRNYHYFTHENLDKVRNIMCTYVWQHLDLGYMQGMCDLVAPLLVILDDEARTYACFCRLMQRMVDNFPNGGAMDNHFANMRSLIQILDAEMFELMVQNGDYTHFYFCYRWFLLDFKRELLYDDVFSVWETIWAARNVSSAHFVLFIALALVESYRDIILSNSMDFTDIIKFFNEMAERHDAKAILNLARELVFQLQTLIENK